MLYAGPTKNDIPIRKQFSSNVDKNLFYEQKIFRNPYQNRLGQDTTYQESHDLHSKLGRLDILSVSQLVLFITKRHIGDMISPILPPVLSFISNCFYLFSLYLYLENGG